MKVKKKKKTKGFDILMEKIKENINKPGITCSEKKMLIDTYS